MKHKALIIIMDGLGDRPVAELNGLTPLENAQTPFFDKLVSKGMGAMVDPLTPGMPVSTHTGMALLMGLTPKDTACLSRGPVEAAGINLSAREGDVLLRCNFAHIEAAQEGHLNVLDRRAGRVNHQTEALAQALNDIELPYGIKASLHPATQHRAVLHLQGKNLSAKISDTDCSQSVPANVQQCQPLSSGKAARQTAEAVNLFSRQAHQILTAHPVNKQRLKQGKIPATGIICRSAGQINSINNLLNYYKIKTAVISGETTVQGLSKLFGFTTVTRPEFTALIDTDLKTKVESSLKAMKHHDLVYLHIKGTDICAHDHQAKLKSQFIEKIDAALADIEINNTIIAVTGDHSTDSNTGFHCGDPVPSILYSPYGRHDKSMTYSEQECLYGGLGRLSANSFLLSVLDQMGYLHNFKKEDTPYIEPVHVSSKISSECHKN
ncbi:MAG: 2,3-bisphosphoglycerate-independent phosphoglycerate mutase [Gammaproteobacteria bacterium]|nr:2,3-bisphosphoglycerate-independent phosphoglycerate mutase [Gammaproteobacteria bacterium]